MLHRSSPLGHSIPTFNRHPSRKSCEHTIYRLLHFFHCWNFIKFIFSTNFFCSLVYYSLISKLSVKKWSWKKGVEGLKCTKSLVRKQYRGKKRSPVYRPTSDEKLAWWIRKKEKKENYLLRFGRYSPCIGKHPVFIHFQRCGR